MDRRVISTVDGHLHANYCICCFYEPVYRNGQTPAIKINTENKEQDKASMKNTFLLSNGTEIPAIGMGTYPLNGKTLMNAVYEAYCCGYRLFDTADNYYNEEDLGESLKALYCSTDAKRDKLFLISKLSDELYEPGRLGGGLNKGLYFWRNSPVMQCDDAVRRVVKQKINHTLEALHTDYLDLLLMHWPYPDYFEEIWYEMENLYKEGVVKAIGVCNCRERHFEKLRKNCTIFPMVNQFESSPLNTKQPLADYCKTSGIHIMTYSPLMSLRLKSSSAYAEYLSDLAIKYSKTKAQVILRFDVQRGFTPIPKSAHKERLQSNFDIFDFELTNEEIKCLLGFNENRQYLPESKSCPGL